MSQDGDDFEKTKLRMRIDVLEYQVRLLQKQLIESGVELVTGIVNRKEYFDQQIKKYQKAKEVRSKKTTSTRRTQ